MLSPDHADKFCGRPRYRQPRSRFSVLARLALPATTTIATDNAKAGKLRLRQQPDTAKAKGSFGAPGFFAGEEMLRGKDRQDDALASAAS